MYYYPDKNDVIVNKVIKDGSWKNNKIERDLYSEALSCFKAYQTGILLDAGCGKGRLLPIAASYFKEIIALDPDIKRLNFAINRLKKLPKENIARYFHSQIQHFTLHRNVDCVICSHVIQHVVTTEIPKIFKKIFQLLKPKGKLILTTTNWPENEEQFVIIDHQTFKEKVVNEVEFNDFVSRNLPGLPTRHFTEKALRRIFAEANFKIILLKKYHGFPKTRGDNFIVAEKNNA